MPIAAFSQAATNYHIQVKFLDVPKNPLIGLPVSQPKLPETRRAHPGLGELQVASSLSSSAMSVRFRFLGLFAARDNEPPIFVIFGEPSG